MRARVIASFLPCSMVDTCRVAPAECCSKSSSPRDKRYRAPRRASSHAEPRRAAPSHAEPRRTTPRPGQATSRVEPRRARSRVTPLYNGVQPLAKRRRDESRASESRTFSVRMFRRSEIEAGSSPGYRRDIEDAMSINIRRA